MTKQDNHVFKFDGHSFTQGQLKTIKREMMGEIPIQCFLPTRVRSAVIKHISEKGI